LLLPKFCFDFIINYGKENIRTDKISAINNFIENKIHHFETSVNSFDPSQKPDSNKLDEAFIKIIDNCNLK